MMLDTTSGTFKTALSTMQPFDEAVVDEISIDAGTCLAIEWHSPLNALFPDKLLFSLSRAKIRRDVCIVKGIGERTRDKLARSGLRRLEDLLYSSRRSWRTQAASLLDWIDNDRFALLRATRRIKDLDLMFCFKPEKVAYIDIETTGLNPGSRVFAVAIGIAAPEEKLFKITQLFARDYTEEFTIVKRAVDILNGVDCIVSFNGKAFDVPVLKSRAWYYLGDTDGVFDRHHVDLLHELRRVQGLKRRTRLVHFEASILHATRALDVPSAMIPAIYEGFVARGGGPAFTSSMKAAMGNRQTLPVARSGINETFVDIDFETADMLRVLHHNMIDVKSLHDLLGWALRKSYAKARANDQPYSPQSGRE
ncbi:MAG: ribonuclease H-like domain-containing protein [Candidatus Sigynarchaeota archaeon]